MDDLTHISTIRALLGRHGFSFSKKLGQNFLVNPSVCPRMAEASGASMGVGVLEIGPGVGVLTRELALCAEKVAAIELDSSLLPVLHETLHGCVNVHVIHGDVLKINLAALLRDEFPGLRVVVCANLPYYITSPILMALLEQKLPIESITVMLQKEAAVRICARPGTRAAGAISVAVWYYAEPEFLFPVGAASFMPRPKVDSAVIRLRVRPAPAVRVADEAFFFAFVRAAFSQRRKLLTNAVSAGLHIPKGAVETALKAFSLESTTRIEELTMEQMAALADALAP